MDAYDRIVEGIKRKARDAAACSVRNAPPPNPYTRSDFYTIWRQEFARVTELTEAVLLELEAKQAE